MNTTAARILAALTLTITALLAQAAPATALAETCYDETVGSPYIGTATP